MGAGRARLRWAALLAAPCAWLVIIALARAGVRAPERLLAPVAELSAFAVQSLLGWTGVDVHRVGAFVFVPGRFAYEVAIGCTGLLPAGVLLAAVLASPGSAAAKWRGAVVGVPLVLGVNLLRLAHLFFLGVHTPWLFALAHTVLWEGAMVLVTFATWFVWTRWAARQGDNPRKLRAVY